MRVTVKLFATFRRYLPESSQEGRYEIDLPAGTEVAAALAAAGLPARACQGAVVLVNGRTAHLDQMLHEDDVVTAFPAMAGGSGLLHTPTRRRPDVWMAWQNSAHRLEQPKNERRNGGPADGS